MQKIGAETFETTCQYARKYKKNEVEGVETSCNFREF